MNIDIFGTKLIFEIKKGHKDLEYDDEYDDPWCHTKIQVKNKYFDYSAPYEIFTNGEIEYLYQKIGKLLNDVLKEKECITFIEPDITFTLHPKGDIRIHKDIYVEFEIYVVGDKLCYDQQSYKINLGRNHIIKLYKYLKKVLCK